MGDIDDGDSSGKDAPWRSASRPSLNVNAFSKPRALPSASDDPDDDHSAPDDDPPATERQSARHWRPILNRWLLTLNPGRTQDEYAKAVRYFFETPGVPQDLSDITSDLLLAYRGALALRADRRRRSMPRQRAAALQRDGLSTSADHRSALPGAQRTGADSHGAQAAFGAPASLRQGALSPATVNIRLTALRQFMLFAIEQELLPSLSPERVRSALRRLKNERRRPYQILAEDEWDEFLRAALGPPEDVPDRASEPPASSALSAPPQRQPHGPWGMTRAAREQERQRRLALEVSAAQVDAAHAPAAADAEADTRLRTHDGRTGARTAQRDHALVSLALATGLRAIELSLLDVGDLVAERRRGRTEWWLNLPDEKTKGQRGGRSLPLAPELISTMLDYLRATGRSFDTPEHRETPLFLALTRGRSPFAERSASRAVQPRSEAPDAAGRRYRRLRPEQIRGVIHRVEAQWLAQRRAAAIAAGDAIGDTTGASGETRHISPHALRHSAAIALLLGDEASERPPASVEHVRGWLGHFDIRTTQRYLAHIESRDQRRRFAIRPHTGAAPASPEAEANTPPDQPSLFDEH